MRWFGVLLTVALVAGCAEGPPARRAATPIPDATREVSRLTLDDERCARRTFDRLIAAVNAGDEARLTSLFGGSFQWLGVSGAASYDVRGAVEALLEVSRSGERWTLKQLDVNGRGWHGGVDFGVEIRRSGPSVSTPYVESAGKGVLDCPSERVMLFGLGEGRVPLGSDSRR